MSREYRKEEFAVSASTSCETKGLAERVEKTCDAHFSGQQTMSARMHKLMAAMNMTGAPMRLRSPAQGDQRAPESPSCLDADQIEVQSVV